MNLFEQTYQALMSCDIGEKIKRTQILYQQARHGLLDSQTPYPIHSIASPGRPDRPKLVRLAKVPKRDRSDIGMISTIHAICHIEFNAINLALDATYRFQDMPNAYYQDWLKVAAEEAKHFTLVRRYLQTLGYDYGDFDAHNGLWQMTHETDYDALARMALVPRVLEARGLDATPAIQRKFARSKFSKMAEILQLIFDDEIGHVKIGNYWYHALCQQQRLDPIDTFDALIDEHIGGKLRSPFNTSARLKANFTQAELDYLDA